MSKLNKLKSWLSLDEAAEYLTEALKEPVEVKDLLQLALDDHLQLAWFANHIPVTDYLGSDYEILNQISDASDSEYKLRFLDGPLRVLLDDEAGSVLKSSLRQFIMPESQSDQQRNGLFVMDSDSQTWQVLEAVENPYQESVTYRPFYSTIGLVQLVVMDSDLQTSVDLCRHPPKKLQNDTDGINLSERETLLAIIGALVTRMLDETLGGRKVSVFKNQSAIIDDLLAHYPDRRGLSKRTLEEKFAEAKRHLSKY